MSSTQIPPAVVFSDWDGTITSLDSNDYLTDNLGFGRAKREEMNEEMISQRLNFRDAFTLMLESINHPFDDCIDILKKNIPLDPGFKDFYSWCKSQGIPVIVVSSGMRPIIKALLLNYLNDPSAADELEIYANDTEFAEDGSWKIKWRHPESGFGHDKSITIKKYISDASYPEGKRPHFFYCGDGVSDLSAARETDLLFAKKGMDLVTYCEREGVPYTTFEDFQDIWNGVRDVVEGKKTIDEVRQVKK
ncbi:hypothetical protein TWF481_012075 [Arthrobotrys musiformis]|uniref:Phosphatase n=1 Tax=Arthrobotrys musiformis TaxID=47236 RepID=A0AAV9VXT4_9PEZI